MLKECAISPTCASYRFCLTAFELVYYGWIWVRPIEIHVNTKKLYNCVLSLLWFEGLTLDAWTGAYCLVPQDHLLYMPLNSRDNTKVIPPSLSSQVLVSMFSLWHILWYRRLREDHYPLKKWFIQTCDTDMYSCSQCQSRYIKIDSIPQYRNLEHNIKTKVEKENNLDWSNTLGDTS